MATTTVTVHDKDVYQLLADGTILQLNETATPPSWKVIDKDPGNVQIVAADKLLVRRQGGDVLRYDGTALQKLRGGVSQLFAWDDQYYISEDGSKNLLHATSSNNTWNIIQTPIASSDLVSVKGTLYQLNNGEIFKYQPEATPAWQSFDSSKPILQITGGNQLYKRHSTGHVWTWDGSAWKLLAQDLRIAQIVAGESGLFAKLKNGTVIKNVKDNAWRTIPSSNDTKDIVVGKTAYRVTGDGKIHRLKGDDTWEDLPDSSVRTKEEQKPNNGNGDNKGNGNGDNKGNGNGDNKGGDSNCTPIEAEELYHGGDPTVPTLLRIGNGGAGQVGLIKHLADAFIKDQVAKGHAPFKIAWYKSDTTESIKYLKDGTVDVAITYTPAAEQLAINQGIAVNPARYIFREHFVLFGPPSNPAKLDPSQSIEEQFSLIYTAAEAGNTKPPTRFLSRYDKSATNIKDSELWIKIGQVPWATKYSNWYHQYMAYPIQALHAAAVLEEYTLSDWGTFLSVDTETTSKIKIYKKGTESGYDPLLMPAHLLIGTKAKNPDMAKTFADWLTSNAGQAFITSFVKNGEQVYSIAPKF